MVCTRPRSCQGQRVGKNTPYCFTHSAWLSEKNWGQATGPAPRRKSCRFLRAVHQACRDEKIVVFQSDTGCFVETVVDGDSKVHHGIYGCLDGDPRVEQVIAEVIELRQIFEILREIGRFAQHLGPPLTNPKRHPIGSPVRDVFGEKGNA